MNSQQIAQHAYHAYAGVTDNKNHQGGELPAFENLAPQTQRAWEAAILGAFNAVPICFPIFYPVEAKLPEPGKLVLVTMLDGKTEIIRTGYYLPRFHRLEDGEAQYDSDINPADGKPYWPSDWYEYFWGENCDTPFPAIVTGWMEIPGRNLPTASPDHGAQALAVELIRLIQEHGNPAVKVLKSAGGSTWMGEVSSVEISNGDVHLR